MLLLFLGIIYGFQRTFSEISDSLICFFFFKYSCPLGGIVQTDCLVKNISAVHSVLAINFHMKLDHMLFKILLHFAPIYILNRHKAPMDDPAF